MQAKTDANLIPSKILSITVKVLAPLFKLSEAFILCKLLWAPVKQFPHHFRPDELNSAPGAILLGWNVY